MTSILTTPAELRAALETGRYPAGGPVRLLDVRWRLDRPDGREDYLRGHIPSAVYVDLETELAEHSEPGDGRHPIPSIERFERAARSWGLRSGDTVVVYDDIGGLSAARAWWLLRHAGMGDVRVLDGALDAWRDAGFALAGGAEPTPPEPGDVELRYGSLRTLELGEVADFARRAPLLDARAPERYRGETEPIDPVAGHIPGAVSAPTGDNLDGSGRFLGPAELRARFTALGARPETAVGSYCGSGVTAAHQALALALAGFEPVLFPGSWSQWSNHPELPIATGAEPG